MLQQVLNFLANDPKGDHLGSLILLTIFFAGFVAISASGIAKIIRAARGE
jgi:hypothetical protein